MALSEKTILVAIIVAFTAVAFLLVSGLISERPEGYPELYILGEDRTASPDSYPAVFFMEEPRTIYVGLRNQLGSVETFKIKLKLWNQSSDKPPFEAPTLYVFQTALKPGEEWERQVTIKFKASGEEDTMIIEINDVVSYLKNIKKRTPLRMVFELYRYQKFNGSFILYKSPINREPVWVQFWFELD